MSDLEKTVNEGTPVLFSPSHAAPDPKVDAWKAGEYLYCHAHKKNPMGSYLAADDLGAQFFFLALYKGTELLGHYSWQLQRSEVFSSKPGALSAPIISDPKDMTLCFFNTVFPELIAGLPDGTHNLTVQLEARNTVNSWECLARGDFKAHVDAAARSFLTQNTEEAKKAAMERGGVVVRGGIQVHGPEEYELSIGGNRMQAGIKALLVEKDQVWLHPLWQSGTISGSAYNKANSADRIFTVTRSGAGCDIHDGHEMHPVVFSITENGEVTKGGAVWATINGDAFNPGDDDQITRIAIGLYYLSDIWTWQPPAGAGGQAAAQAAGGGGVSFFIKNCAAEAWNLLILEKTSGQIVNTVPVNAGETVSVEASADHVLLGGAASAGSGDFICPFDPNIQGQTLEVGHG